MRVAQAALILMLGSLSGRLLGLVREQTVAALFGQTSATDAFTASWRVPTTLYDLLIGGTISAALVPVLAGYAADREHSEAFWRLASLVCNLAALVLAVATAAAFWLAPQAVGFLSPGLVARGPEVESQAVMLLQLMLPALAFMGLSGVFTALLYARERFLLPALGATAFNAAIVVAGLLLHRQLGIASLALGLLVGAFLQMALQVPGLRHWRYSLALDLSHPGLRQILRLYLPVALGLLVSAVQVGIDTNLASRTLEGDLSAMRNATTLIQFPLGLVAMALGFAILPGLSRAAADEKHGSSLVAAEAGRRYRQTLVLGLKLAALAILPAAVGLVVLREPVVQLLFQRGAFGPYESERTALAFLAYSPGLPAAAIDQLLIFAFYARQNTITPVLVGVLGAGVYLVTALALVGPWGMPGLALANSAQWSVHMLVMLVLLWRAIGGLRGLGLGVVAAKAAAAAGIMGLLVAWSWPHLAGTVGAPFPALALVAALGVGAYGGAMVVLRVEEVGTAWGLVRLRFGQPRTTVEGGIGYAKRDGG